MVREIRKQLVKMNGHTVSLPRYLVVKTVNETVKVSDTQEKILQILNENEAITYEEFVKMSFMPI